MSENLTILALETSTDLCSAALSSDGVLHVRKALAPREHTQVLMGQIDAIFEESNKEAGGVHAVAFGCGPGTFSGVRVATAIAQGIAVASGARLWPVSSLSALAWRLGHECGGQVLAVMDARLGQVYWGAYEIAADALRVVQEERLDSITELPALLEALSGDWIGGGNGWDLSELAPALIARVRTFDAAARPDAQAVLDLALRTYSKDQGVAVEDAQPTYLRHPVRQ